VVGVECVDPHLATGCVDLQENCAGVENSVTSSVSGIQILL